MALAGPSGLEISIPRCPRCRIHNQAGVWCSGFDKSQTIDLGRIVDHVIILCLFLFLLQFDHLVVEIIDIKGLATQPQNPKTVGH